MQRRAFLQVVALAAAMPMNVFAKSDVPTITVYKSETCGCCTLWVDHLRRHGFDVKTQNVPNTAAYRARFGIPQTMGSCHTAMVGGYALEGHVPATEIRRLLDEKPQAIGLAVPGMPMGSPGMVQAGMLADAYDVLLLREDGSHVIYRRYAGRKTN